MKISIHRFMEKLHIRHRKPVGETTLSAKIIAGPETAEKLGVPVGTEIDLGVISRGDMSMEVKANG